MRHINIIPKTFCTMQVAWIRLDSIHSISHSGIKSPIKMMKARFYWTNMDKTIKELCAACTFCQQAKIYKHVKSPVETLQILSERFHTLHIHIVEPLPTTKSPNNPYIRAHIDIV